MRDVTVNGGQTETKADSTPGPKIKIPDGKNFVDLVRLAMSSQETSLSRASKFVGLSRDSYKLCRQLLLIKARGLLTPAEREIVDKAIGFLSSGNRKDAESSVVDILKKYWKTGTMDGNYRPRKGGRHKIVVVDAKKKSRFEKKIFYIREICSSDDEVDIPMDLTDVDRQKIITILSASIGFLSRLTMKVNGEENDDE
jgi:hypothetical protein